MNTAMCQAYQHAKRQQTKVTNKAGEVLLTISVSELQKNLKQIVNMLDRGVFIEIQKRNRKIAMLVPY